MARAASADPDTFDPVDFCVLARQLRKLEAVCGRGVARSGRRSRSHRREAGGRDLSLLKTPKAKKSSSVSSI